jgi:hypothetical protein
MSEMVKYLFMLMGFSFEHNNVGAHRTGAEGARNKIDEKGDIICRYGDEENG